MKEKSKLIRAVLDVPFYRQTLDFSCGPACLIMAMKYFDPNLRASRELEIDIWREANLVEVYGTSRFGLALAAWRRGFEVYSCGVEEGTSFVEGVAEQMPNLNRDVLKIFYEDVKEKCKRAGIEDQELAPTLSDIGRWLANDQVPLLLMNSAMLSYEVLPHWVVITGIGRRRIRINNPLGDLARVQVSIEVFERNMGFKGTHCAVVLKGKRG
ncbi:MAG: peptidase C39 family protein [Thermoplasmata archaeon]